MKIHRNIKVDHLFYNQIEFNNNVVAIALIKAAITNFKAKTNATINFLQNTSGAFNLPLESVLVVQLHDRDGSSSVKYEYSSFHDIYLLVSHMTSSMISSVSRIFDEMENSIDAVERGKKVVIAERVRDFMDIVTRAEEHISGFVHEYVNATLSASSLDFQAIVDFISDNQDEFIEHYREDYPNPWVFSDMEMYFS